MAQGQDYPKKCDNCQNMIVMSSRSGRWGPYNPDGSDHRCKGRGGSGGSQPYPRSYKTGGGGMTEQQATEMIAKLTSIEEKLENLKAMIEAS